jgi:serine/threonine protein kinase
MLYTDEPLNEEGWESRDIIGRGSAAIVIAGTSANGFPVAIKLFDLAHARSKLSFANELKVHTLLTNVKHKKSIATVYSTFSRDSIGAMTMKRYDSDLFDSLASITTERKVRKVFKRICRGVHTLHRNGIAHLDIKPENILMKGDKPHLCDFGDSYLIRDIQDTAISVYHPGTKEYASPERRELKRFLPFPADIFSLGITLHVLLTGSFPYVNDSNQNLESIQLVPHLSTRASELLTKMLSVVPEERPTIKQVLCHEWLM